MGFLLPVIFVATAGVSPPSVELEWLTDSTVNPPGVEGQFLIETGPVPCRSSVLFTGITFDDVRPGLYSASSAGLQVIANAETPVPGSNNTFQDISEQDCGGGQIVFLGDDDTTPASTGRSVYRWTQGVTTPIIGQGILIGNREVQSFNRLANSASAVAMVAALVPASVSQGVVVKPFGGEPFTIADETTVLPGQTNPTTIFSQPVLKGLELVFHARTQQNLGIYRWTEAQGLLVVADTATPVPLPGGGTFGIFNWISILDYGVVFGAGYPGGFGIFVWDAGRIQPLVVPGDLTELGEPLVSAALPNGRGSFLSFTARTDDEPFAVYVRFRDGTLRRILGLGDTIDGRTVGTINSAADNTSVSVLIRSTGNPPVQAIYRASFAETIDIPVLSRLGLAALAAGLVLSAFLALSRRSRTGLRR